MNKTQRLQQWFEDHPRWDHASYGEFMHVGANQTIFRITLQEQELTPDAVVLDVACAIGGNARWLASLYGCRVYGNDIDEDAISVAKDLAEIEEVADLCEFVVAPVDSLPFDSEMFDLVISTDIYDPAEVKRVLKPGGVFITLNLVDDPHTTPLAIAEEMGLDLESSLDVTDLAFAFHRAKEAEARLLLESKIIGSRELVQVMNENIAPYARGGRHYLMRLRKSD